MLLIQELLNTKQINRRTIRHTLFRIRESSPNVQISVEAVHELKGIIESQFIPGLTWDNFTFDWDVSSADPLKVVTPLEWDGRVDPATKRCDPSAFTKQGI